MSDKPATKAAKTDRRSFISGLGALGGRIGFALTALAGLTLLRRGQAAPAGARGRLGIVRPPGALPEAEFLARCIRCTRCADSCETQCILLFGHEAGDLHRTPYVMPGERACNMCLKCGETCPSEALMPLTDKAEVDMGEAVVDERLCVSHNGTGVCGACHTACPVRNQAITQGFRDQPEVHPDHCTGCGMCEEFCIVRDRRAIQVATGRLWGGMMERVPE